MSAIVTSDSTTGMCPFCGGAWAVTYEDNGDTLLLHSLPICNDFDRDEPQDFMERVLTLQEQKKVPSA